jgi:OmpA-OmpF porin, OOP family
VLSTAVAGFPQAVRFEVGYAAGDKFTITERSDLRRFEDNKFVGLSYREVRGVLGIAQGQQGAEASGSFLVFEETRRDARLVAKRIDDVVPVRFSVRPDGTYDVPGDQPYPALRSFPVFPARDLSPGDRWEAWGGRVVEPLRDGKFTRLRIYSGYEYQGPVMRDGRALELVTARYALRYKAGEDPLGDPRIRGVSGSHSAKIYFDAARRRPVFVETLADELYTLDSGKSIGFKGFILTWYEGVAAMDRGDLVADIRKALGPALSGGEPSAGAQPGGRPGTQPGATRGTGPAAAGEGGSGSVGAGQGARVPPATGSGTGGATSGGAAGSPLPGGLAGEIAGALTGTPAAPGAGAPGAPGAGVTVSETPEGVKLVIGSIRFVADEAVVLPEEKPRLEAVAKALKGIPGRTFRVIGHTAAAGTAAGQKTLSVERASAVVDFLVASGIESRRFVYEGRGATEPIAPNDTEQGRTLNRRVEIIVLED